MSYGSKTKVWWIGDCGHEWEAVIKNRVSKKQNCPICSNRKTLPGFNDLATTHPKLMKLWHPTRNGDLTPEQLTAGSSKKIWWVCDKGHEWETKVYNITAGTGCPYCAGKKTLPGFNDLATLNPQIASQWHPTRNGLLTPENVTGKSSKVFWWQCEKGHEWRKSVYKRSTGHGCPICAGYKVHPGFNDLATTHPELVEEWDYETNFLKPTQVSYGSLTGVFWVCKIGHKWCAPVYNRTKMRSGCPYCAGQKPTPGFNDLATTHPQIASEWHPTRNGERKPTQFLAGSGSTTWWLGECGHEWETTIYNRTKGTGCPECYKQTTISQPEHEIHTFIQNNYTGPIITHDRGILDGKEIDIYLPELKLGIEYNGAYWHSLETGTPKDYHYLKWVLAEKQNINLLFVWENDWKTGKETILNQIQALLTAPPEEWVTQFNPSPETVTINGSFQEIALKNSFTYEREQITSFMLIKQSSPKHTIWGAGESTYIKTDSNREEQN